MRKSDESQAPAIRNASSVAERDRVAAEIREKFAGDADTAGLFEAAMRSAQLFLAGRERAKTNCVMVINEMRMALYEYGRRLVERGVDRPRSPRSSWSPTTSSTSFAPTPSRSAT